MVDLPDPSDPDPAERADSDDDGWGSPVPAEYGSLKGGRPRAAPRPGQPLGGARTGRASPRSDPADQGRPAGQGRTDPGPERAVGSPRPGRADRWSGSSLMRRLQGDGPPDRLDAGPASDPPPDDRSSRRGVVAANGAEGPPDPGVPGRDERLRAVRRDPARSPLPAGPALAGTAGSTLAGAAGPALAGAAGPALAGAAGPALAGAAGSTLAGAGGAALTDTAALPVVRSRARTEAIDEVMAPLRGPSARPDVAVAGRGGRANRRRPARVRSRATICHLDLLTVIRVSVIFWLVIMAAVVVASLLLYEAADVFGSLTSIEKSVRTLFSLKSFTLHPGVIAEYTALGGIVICVVGTLANVVFALIYNLIADVVGGVRVEIETLGSE